MSSKHALVLSAILFAACARSNEPRPMPVPSSESGSPTPIASATPSSTAPTDPLPPVDVACSVDADCTTTELYYSPSDHGCCQGCDGTVANTKWVTLADARCHSIGFGEGCPMKKCAAPEPVACKSGRCDWK